MDLRTELNELLDSLDAMQIPYALCGGLALAIYGLPRFTQDIDLLIQESDLASACAAAERVGFTVETQLKAGCSNSAIWIVKSRSSPVIDASFGSYTVLRPTVSHPASEQQVTRSSNMRLCTSRSRRNTTKDDLPMPVRPNRILTCSTRSGIPLPVKIVGALSPTTGNPTFSI